MCRFIAYKGAPRLIDDIVIKPSNSLLCQSSNAKESVQHINADGLGLGWYNNSIGDIPAVFRSTQPAWNDKNLLDLARIISTDCFFAHIRAANSGDISLFNCHPFRFERFLFMHNGFISNFAKIKRKLRQRLSNDKYNWISGQTDSEHLFALFLENLSQYGNSYSADDLAKAFQNAIAQLTDILIADNITEPSPINIALTDGQYLLACRYSTFTDEPINSLYYHNDEQSIIIASEKLNDQSDTTWKSVPINHMIVCDNNNQFKLTLLHQRYF